MLLLQISSFGQLKLNQQEWLSKKIWLKHFEAKTGIAVEVIPIDEKELGKRATAAAAAGDLPDVIYHTLQYVLPWAEAGILDVDANNDVVKELGKETLSHLVL